MYPVLNNINYSIWVAQAQSELILLDLYDRVITVDVEKEEDMTDEEYKYTFKKVLAAQDQKLMRKTRDLLVTRVKAGQITHLNSPDPSIYWDRVTSC